MPRKAGFPLRYRLLLAGLFLLAYGLMVSSAIRKSATVDEQAHLFRGVAYLKSGATHFLLGHPLLGGVLSALPLLSEPDLQLPVNDAAWEQGDWSVASDQFLWRLNDHPQRLILLGRLSVIWSALLLGALLFRWGRDWRGTGAGLICATLSLLDPNILAHGRLITGDIGVTLFFVMSLYGYWRWVTGTDIRLTSTWRSTGRDNVISILVAGLGLGLAVATKFNAALLVIILGFWAFFLVRRRRKLAPIAAFLAVGIIGWLVVWGLYRFSMWHGFLPGGAFWEDLSWFLRYSGKEHGQYLLGKFSSQGWWYYFPITLIVKTPLPTLLIFIWAVWQNIFRGNWQRRLFLLFPPLVYFAASLIGALNIGYRYLLPMLPFLFLAGGTSLEETRLFKTRKKVLVSLIVLGYGLLAIWIWPDYLSYFNVLAGGNGWRILSDSNVDWGQDLPALARWQASAATPLKLSYFGTAHPSAYGLVFEPLPTWPAAPEQSDPANQLYNPADPAPGYYAISITNLHGVVLGSAQDSFAFFRSLMPETTIGGSIFIYRVPARGDAVNVAFAGVKPADLYLDLHNRFGSNDIRPRLFDASVSFIWPMGGGWLATTVDSLPATGQVAAFWPGSPVAKLEGQLIYPLSEPPNLNWATGKVEFGGLLTYLGHSPIAADETRLSLITAWSVQNRTTRALKIFVHALDGQGSILGQWDGIGVVPDTLQPGDLFVQEHTIPLAPDAKPVVLSAGLYDGVTLERLGEPVTIPLSHP